MTPLGIGDIAIALVAFGLLTWAGIRKAGLQTEEDFLVGGRGVTWPLLSATISAGVMGGGVLMVYAEYLFKYGLSALWIIGGLLLGILCIVPIAGRFKKLADNQGFLSLPDFYAFQWGRKSGFLAAIVVGLWTFGFILMQLISAGTVLSALTGWGYGYCVVAGAATVASYLLISGFRAVIVTDMLQYGALLVLLVILLGVSAVTIAPADVLKVTMESHWDMGESFGFFFLGALNILVSADLWQRVYSAKSTRDARLGFLVSLLLIAVAAFLLVYPLIYVRKFLPDTPSGQALVLSLPQLLPRPLLAVGLVGLLATVVSALDTMTFLFGLALAHDIGVRQLHLPVERRLFYTRLAMVLILVIGCGASIEWRDLERIGIALSTIGLILAPPLLLLLTRWKPKGESVEWGMGFGLLLTLGMILTKTLTPENSVVAFLGALIITLVAMLYHKPRKA